MIYQPLEDSFLLEEQAKKIAKGTVLDMGTGSGIQAAAAAKKRNVKEVIAVDVQKDVIESCIENVKNKKIKFLVSDLFEAFKKDKKLKNKKFDTIIFNPPYLPAKPKLGDLTVEGGKKGFETVQRFLKEAKDYLKDNGTILLLISSMTNKAKVEEIMTKKLYEFKEIAQKHLFFEDIFVYAIQKNKVLEKAAAKGIKEIKYFTKGHRGMLFTGIYKRKKIVLKAKLPESQAKGAIPNEISWLKKLSKYKIGPKILVSNKEYFAYQYLEGDFIVEFLEKGSKKKIKSVLEKILLQCHRMDKLKMNKEEMHHPIKHIIVDSKFKPTLIDFERAHKSQKPKNVTQFLQFIGSGYIEPILRRKRIFIKKKILIKVGQGYRNSMKIDPVLALIQAQ